MQLRAILVEELLALLPFFHTIVAAVGVSSIFIAELLIVLVAILALAFTLHVVSVLLESLEALSMVLLAK